MKSYSEYIKEEKKKQQKKIDSMKPLDRMDYINRLDRVIKRTNTYASFIVFISLMKIGLGIMLFSILLISLETETGLLLCVNLLIMCKYIVISALCMYPVMVLEVILKSKVKRKQINELNKKYNL